MLVEDYKDKQFDKYRLKIAYSTEVTSQSFSVAVVADVVVVVAAVVVAAAAVSDKGIGFVTVVL